MLQLPLSAVVLATMLVSSSGAGAGPPIIVGVVVAYITTIALHHTFAAGKPETPPKTDRCRTNLGARLF